ncbi:MAG: DNA-3-methyladenine glycosylase [Actinobacteria bacterium]|nr:DNA-3-methyladenine glycosylase [Actinomycetota bacterium]
MDFDLKEISASCLNDKNVLGIDFYNRDTSLVARELIGKMLCKKSEYLHANVKTTGIIIETEAYYGTTDAASHASKGKTMRSEIMFGRAGMSYVYFCYGMYYMLNAVTEEINMPGAVLIRAVWPLEQTELMIKRRMMHRAKIKSKKRQTANFVKKTAEDVKNKDFLKKLKYIADGPGKLTVAFGIDISDNKKDLTDIKSGLSIYDCGIKSSSIKILSSPRIGISSAKELHLRYFTEAIIDTKEAVRFLK